MSRDELLKKGIDIDRKRIEVPGRSIKSVGSYKVAIRLYEKDEAILRILIQGQAGQVRVQGRGPQATPAPYGGARGARGDRGRTVPRAQAEGAPQSQS